MRLTSSVALSERSGMVFVPISGRQGDYKVVRKLMWGRDCVDWLSIALVMRASNSVRCSSLYECSPAFVRYLCQAANPSCSLRRTGKERFGRVVAIHHLVMGRMRARRCLWKDGNALSWQPMDFHMMSSLTESRCFSQDPETLTPPPR